MNLPLRVRSPKSCDYSGIFDFINQILQKSMYNEGMYVIDLGEGDPRKWNGR